MEGKLVVSFKDGKTMHVHSISLPSGEDKAELYVKPFLADGTPAPHILRVADVFAIDYKLR